MSDKYQPLSVMIAAIEGKATTPDACRCGGAPTIDPRQCPFDAEMNGEDETQRCDCCDSCRDQCAYDI